jgi:hypothetical protein
MLGVFQCLQGLYNFFVYISPKVKSAKRSRRENITWCQAFKKAWMSKGDRRIARESVPTSRTNF